MPNPIYYGIITLIISGLLIKHARVIHKRPQFQPVPSSTIINPINTIAFDLNGVVLRFSPLRALRIALSTKHKLKLLQAACRPSLIWDILKLAYRGNVVEQSIMQIKERHPDLIDLIPLALQMANAQLPIPETVQLIQDLKIAGYRVLALSNLGEQSAQILAQKYPQLFNLFDGVLVTSAQDNYLMKPHPAAFKKFLSKFQLDPKRLIFIDDKLKNISAANRYGIIGIRFINPCQCRQDLLKHVNSI